MRRRGSAWRCLSLAAVLLIAATARCADEIEFLTGEKMQGTVISETVDSIVFNSGGAQLKLALKQIRAITVKGQRRVLDSGSPVTAVKAPSNASAPPPAVASKTPAAPAAANATGAGVTRTKAEIEALIAKEGASPPSWWESVPLNVPTGLDLTWQTPPKGSGWDASKWLGQYMWSTINENPAKWKDGVRLLHHVLTVNEKDPAKLKQTMNALATAYAELLDDWARAAFWWRKGGGGGHAGYSNQVALARCYWKLGNRDMAVEMLATDKNVNPDLIRCWGDLGETDKALQMAEPMVKSNFMVAQAAGDVCRISGLNPKALDYYQKALAGMPASINQMVKDRLQGSIDAIKAADVLSHLDKIADGTYVGSSIGYVGPVEVTVKMKGGKIESCSVTQHHEKQYYSSIAEVPARIIQKQGIKGVDTTTGATLTSEAIINASAKAIVGAAK